MAVGESPQYRAVAGSLGPVRDRQMWRSRNAHNGHESAEMQGPVLTRRDCAIEEGGHEESLVLRIVARLDLPEGKE
jgi:hypothetical protein